MDTPTNVRRILNEEDEEEEEGGISRSLSVSSDDLNTTHLIPPPSPAAGLRPNRRSVEALKKVSLMYMCINVYVYLYMYMAALCNVHNGASIFYGTNSLYVLYVHIHVLTHIKQYYSK